MERQSNDDESSYKFTQERIIQLAEWSFEKNPKSVAIEYEKLRSKKTSYYLDCGSKGNGVEYLSDKLNLNLFQKDRFILETPSPRSFSEKSLARRPDRLYRFRVAFLFSRDYKESSLIRNALNSKNFSNDALIIVDLSSTPFNLFGYEKFIKYAGKNAFCKGFNTKFDDRYLIQAEKVVDDWINEAINGLNSVCYLDNKYSVSSIEEIKNALKEIQSLRFPNLFDSEIEDQLNSSSFINYSKSDVSFKVGATFEPDGVFSKQTLEKVFSEQMFFINFGMDWKGEDSRLSRIRLKLDKLIEERIQKNGVANLRFILEHIQKEEGFAPNNFFAMVLGFLLSDYLNKDFSFFNITGTKVEKYDFSFYIYELFKNINLNVTNQPYDVIFYRWNSKYEKFCRFISELFHFEYQGSIEDAIQNSIVAIEEWSCPFVAFETLLSEESKRIARLILKTIITRYRDWPHNTILELVDSLTKETELEIKTVVKKENGDEAFFKMIRELDRSGVIKDKVNQRDAVLEETRKLVPASAYWLWNRGDFDSLVNSTEIVKQGHVPCNKDCERCNNRCMIGLKKYGFKNVSI